MRGFTIKYSCFLAKCILLCVIISNNSIKSYGQQYNFKKFHLETDLDINIQSGLETSLFSSSKGYLYISGNESIYRFDGKNAELVNLDIQLPFSEITNISQKSDGTLYFLNNGRLSCIDKDEFKEIPIEESVNAYLSNGDDIYFGVDDGLKKYDQVNNIIEVPDPLLRLKGIKINALLKDENFLYIGSENGLWTYNLKSKTVTDFGKSSNANLLNITQDQNKVLWSFDDIGNIYEIDVKRRKFNQFKNPRTEFSSIACDHTNRLWFGTRNKGILSFDQESQIWKVIDEERGLSDNRVLQILIDHWGSVWIHTADLQISKFIDKDYEVFDVYNDLPSDQINCLYADGQGLLCSAGTNGVYAYEDGTFGLVANSDVFPNARITSILRDSSELWLGTNGNGLVKITENEYTVFRKESGIASNWISNLARDTIGNIWVASPSNGLTRLSQRDSLSLKIDRFGLEEGLSDLNITALKVLHNGTTYFGTQSGSISIINGERIITLNDDVGSEVTDIIEDESGTIYFITFNDGVFQYQNLKKSSFEKLEFEGFDFPTKVRAASIKDAKLWLANDKGIHSVPLTTKNQVFQQFTTANGFPSSSISRGAMLDYLDMLWVGTAKGLVKIGDLNFGFESKKPLIHFDEVQVDFVPIELTSLEKGKFRIKHNENVSFSFQGVDINSDKDLSYSYILEGRDKMWSPWNKNKNQNYNSLNAGSYDFKVKTKSVNGEQSEILQMPFTVKGPLWKEWWFVPGLIIFGLLALGLIFRNRIVRIKKKNAEEKAQLELKNRLLELEQKANQLQMNPHFIFNALNSIQSTVAKEDYKDARKEINDFAVLMRSILSNSKERVITLQDELNLLEKYIQIEKTCRALEFDYEIIVDDAIDKEELMIPPMLIQPFIENAIIHGLKKKQSGELLLKISLLNEYVLLCEVIDNGAGYDNTKKESREKKHKSVAIEVTKERLENLLKKEFFPVLKIEQIDKEQGGTKVQLKIPAEYNF